jgi:uncharacterized protein YjlB
MLGICCSDTRVRFGRNAGIALTVRPGDAVVIPSRASEPGSGTGFLMVGAYPRGSARTYAAASPTSGSRRSTTSHAFRCRQPALV